METWFRGFFLLLLPLALADVDLPCEGFEVLEGLGLVDAADPATFGVKLMKVRENVEADQDCWKECCDTVTCDLAVLSDNNCYLLRCNVKGFNMCDLTVQEGARSYRKVDTGAQPSQEDFCLPQSETGSCRASFTRWWYNAETETCSNFTYGGCPVNLNNHAGEDECMEKCRGVKATKAEAHPTPERLVAESPRAVKKPEPVDQDSTYKSFTEYCAAAPSTGKCRAAFRRFYYDPKEMACKPFVYGGCMPNKNNYLTENECLNTCEGRSEEDDGLINHHVIHRPLTAVVLPILLAIMAASLLGVMIVFFVKMAKKNQQHSDFRAMWNPIDDKECLMNSAYTL